MNGPISYYNLDDLNVPEEEKNSFEYIRQRVDWLIYTTVREKIHLQTARNLYTGRRDRDEFRYLEETFGIETPIEIKMTSLIKTRINALVGLLLDKVFTYTVGVNDVATIKIIEDDKKTELTKKLQATATRSTKQEEPLIPDGFLEDLELMLNTNFISEFEKSVQHLITYYRQSANITYKRKVKNLFKDLLITGECYYRSYVKAEGLDPIFEVKKPENIFYSINTNYEFLREGNVNHVNGVVCREFMTRSEILSKYGEMMDEDSKQALFTNSPLLAGNQLLRHGRDLSRRAFHEDEHYYNQIYGNTEDVLPVYHVEFIVNNPVEISDKEAEERRQVDRAEMEDSYGDVKEIEQVTYRQDRYEAIRIGYEIYLNVGKSKHVMRSTTDPYRCGLTYNGVMLNIREGKPASLALELKDLQDTYDILTFYRDNLIANSGVDGSRVNLAAIPKALGNNFMERVLKFLALRKQGVELIDPTEEGANLFAHYGDFTASLNGNVIEAIEAVKESIERQADIISGVNRHMYQAAEVRDAVSNVRMGQQQTSLVTKEVFELADELQVNILIDMVNAGKIAYSKGKRGTYIMGPSTVAFEIAPKYFCFTDYDIHIVNNDIENTRIASLRANIPELIQAQLLDPDILVKLSMLDSTREILHIVEANLVKKRKENNAAQQLMSENEELKKAYEEVQKTLEQLKAKENTYKDRELTLKEKESQHKMQLDAKKTELEERKTRALEEAAKQEIIKDQEVIKLEREQLHSTNVHTNAREPKNDL